MDCSWQKIENYVFFPLLQIGTLRCRLFGGQLLTYRLLAIFMGETARLTV